MPHEVKMPQLGMTQDSGVIVAWLKGAGDKVAERYPAVWAGEGDDVPVGDVIALIVESADEVSDHSAAAPHAGDEARDHVEGATEEAEVASVDAAPSATGPAPTHGTAPAPAPGAPGPMSNGKVLASPKARRLARERGIDLAALRANGVAEPIHAADLARAPAGGQSALTAEVGGAALTALLNHAGDTADRTRLLAGFARRAWESRFDGEQVAVLIRHLDGTETLDGREGDPVGLVLIDLCDSRLSGYAPAIGTTLTVAEGGPGYNMTLGFAEANLPFAAAAALLDDIAARVEDPIRQLI